MRRQGMTIREAAEEWVREFNAVPQGMIAKLMQHDPEDWREITTPAVGDRVYVYELPESGKRHEGEIVRWDMDTGVYTVKLDDGVKLTTDKDSFEVMYDDDLPMWGTMWSFGDPCDDHWVESEEAVRLMSKCGFRVFESEEFGIYFGIDGAGYDFYEAHWVPLYKARGLEWHDPATEKEAV